MIREIRVGDAQAACEVFVASLGYAATTADVVRRRIEELAGDARFVSLVWEDPEDGQVVGLIHALRYDTLHSEGGWDVISLGVLPEWQGQGIGRALLDACEEAIRARGGAFVRLNSRMERQDAHAFYEHLGYACTKAQKYFVKRLGAGATDAES